MGRKILAQPCLSPCSTAILKECRLLSSSSYTLVKHPTHSIGAPGGNNPKIFPKLLEGFDHLWESWEKSTFKFTPESCINKGSKIPAGELGGVKMIQLILCKLRKQWPRPKVTKYTLNTQKLKWHFPATDQSKEGGNENSRPTLTRKYGVVM